MSWRIVIETERSGKKWYYVQKEFLFLFWVYLREVRDISMYAYRIGFDSLEEAEAQIQKEVNRNYDKIQCKIKYRQIYKIYH